MRLWIGSLLAVGHLLLGAGAVSAEEPPRRFVFMDPPEGLGGFADLASISREGDIALMTVLLVTSAEGAASANFDYATAAVRFNCRGRTTQILDGQAFTTGGVKVADREQDVEEKVDPRDKGQMDVIALACGEMAQPPGPTFADPADAVTWFRALRKQTT